MAAAKKTHTPEEKAKILAKLGGDKTARAIAEEAGISENTLSGWKRAAGMKMNNPGPGKKRRRKAGKRSANGANGHGHVQPTNGLVKPGPEAPVIELKGLRGWVSSEARKELHKVFAAIAEQLR